MSEIRFKLKGVHAIVALGVVAILVVVRVTTLVETDDQKLHEAIKRELMNELGGRIGQDLETFEKLEKKNQAAVAELIERAKLDAIEVHSASVSKPLLSFGSSVDAVVRVEYTLPDGPRQTAYWRFDHSTVAGWRYSRPTIALVYYLNFV